MKRLVQLFAVLFLSFPIFTSCVYSEKPVYGSQQLINKQINVDNYDKVIMNVPGEVLYQQSSDSAPYLQIHTDDNILDFLIVRVQGNQLIIDANKDCIIKPSKLIIYTRSHNLNKVMLNGSGKILLKEEVNSNDLAININGSGILIADSLLCNKLSVDITGSGNMQLIGASNQTLFKITGSGNIEAFDYFVKDLDCEIIGSGNIEALVFNKLDINIVGAGNITYRGEPLTVNRKIVGAGKVQQEK